MRVWLMPEEHERAEIERTAEHFGLDPFDLLRCMSRGGPKTLDQECWSKLENADSSDPLTWWQAHALAERYGRDFECIAQAMRRGSPMPMPIVLKRRNGGLYLVAGNTRLMACRVLQITPEVWLFDEPETQGGLL